jgi:ferredoxin-type protein NapH
LNKFLILWKKYAFIFLTLIFILGLFDSRIFLAFIICMLGPFALGLFNGRFWCGNICPIGNFFDNVVIKISRSKRVPHFLKIKWFKVLALVIMFSMFIMEMLMAKGNVYGYGKVFYRMIIESIVIGAALALLYNHRTWCHFCPMGSMGAFISQFRKNRKLIIVSKECASCKLCKKKCPMGISPYEYKGQAIDSSNCIQCKNCCSSCNIKAIS